MTTWQNIKLWAYKWVGGLFLEDKSGVQVISLGRVAFLIVFGWILTYWTRWYMMPVDPGMLAGLMLSMLPLDQVILSTDVVNACRAAIAETSASRALPPGVLEVFYALATYVFGGKVVDGLRTKWASEPATTPATAGAPSPKPPGVVPGERPTGEGP